MTNTSYYQIDRKKTKRKKEWKKNYLIKRYLRVSVPMIPAHVEVVFVIVAGEVGRGDSCSGCEAPGAFTGMESQSGLTAHARTE